MAQRVTIFVLSPSHLATPMQYTKKVNIFKKYQNFKIFKKFQKFQKISKYSKNFKNVKVFIKFQNNNIEK